MPAWHIPETLLKSNRFEHVYTDKMAKLKSMKLNSFTLHWYHPEVEIWVTMGTREWLMQI